MRSYEGTGSAKSTLRLHHRLPFTIDKGHVAAELAEEVFVNEDSEKKRSTMPASLRLAWFRQTASSHGRRAYCFRYPAHS